VSTVKRVRTSVAAVLAILAGIASSPARGANVGTGRPATFTRAPNYARCTDAADAGQLTDGQRVRNAHIWLERGAVGWEGAPGDLTGIVLDLQRNCRIDSVIVHAAHFPPSGVLPPAVVLGIGETADRFVHRGALAAPTFEPAAHGPRRVRLVVPLAPASGCFVLVALLHQGDFCFTDEIEVHGESGVQHATTAATPSFALDRLAEVAAAQRRFWAMSAALHDFPGTTETARLAARARAWRDGGRAAFEVRRVDPWSPTTPWSDLQPTVADTIELWPGAWGAAAIEYANAASDSLRFDMRTPTPNPLAPVLIPREVIHVEARDGRWSGDALPRARPALRIAPGQVRQLWLDLDARAAAPGFYALTVRLGRQTIALPVRVHPARGDSTSIAALDWTYPEKYALTRTDPDAALTDNRDHGIDSWCFPAEAVPWPDPAAIAPDGRLLQPLDFTACDRALDLHDARRARRLFFYWHFDPHRADPSRARFRHPYGSKPWRRAVADWLQAWMAHLQARGLDLGRVYMQPFDESTAPSVRRCFAMLKAMPARPLLALTVTRKSSPASLRALDPNVDLAILEREALPALDGWIVNALRRNREVWIYDVFEPAKSQPPAAYRALVWEAWARGLSGVSFWAYCDDGERSPDVWNDFDDTRTDFHVVYGRPGAPVDLREPFTPSKRWQAFRIARCETALMEATAARTALRPPPARVFESSIFDPRPLLRAALGLPK
jgi:hypothetical protein